MATNALNIGVTELSGEGFLPLAAVTIPVRDNLAVCLLGGEGLEAAAKNYAPDGDDMTVQGTLTAGDGYVQFAGPAGRLLCGVSDTADMTIFLIAKRNTATDVDTGFIGNQFGAGLGIYRGASTTTLQARALRAGADNEVATITADLSAFGLYVAKFPDTGATVLRSLTSSASNSSVATGARESMGTNGPIKIGSTNNANNSGNAQIMLALVYTSVLTDQEIADVAAWARSYAEEFGVTV